MTARRTIGGVLLTVLLLSLGGGGVAEGAQTYVWAYYDGVAQFEQDGKLGLLDEAGRVLAPAEYDWIDVRSASGLRRVEKDGLVGMLEETGALWQGKLFESLIRLSKEGDLLLFKEKGEDLGMMRADGEVIYAGGELLIYECNWLGYDPEVYIIRESTDLHFWAIHYFEGGRGLMNGQGEWVVEPLYSFDFEHYVDGLVRVKETIGEGKFLYGIAGETGIIVAPEWDDVMYGINPDLFAVCRDGKWGFVDWSGELVLPLRWNGANAFRNGLAVVQAEDGKWGLINMAGEWAHPAVWADCHRWWEAERDADCPVLAMNDEGKWGLVDTQGQVRVDYLWDRIREYTGEAAVVEKDGKYGFVWGLEEVSLPLPYDEVTRITQAVYEVRQGDAAGFVDKHGKAITALEFIPEWTGVAYYAEEFFDWIPCAYLDRAKGTVYINEAGEVMLEIDGYGEPFVGDYACAGISYYAIRGIIDREGNVVLPFDYDRVSQDEDGLFRIRKDNWVSKNSVYGYIGPDFQVISGIKE